MSGAKAIPDALSKPLTGWTKPFNDRYINITRYDMPDASIDDMIDRTVAQAVALACSKGGRVVKTAKGERLSVDTRARFVAPLEFCVGPQPRIEAGTPVDHSFACVTNAGCDWQLAKGTLPEGLAFSNGRLSGTAARPGKYPVTLSLSNGTQRIEKEFTLVVRGRNIAPQADSVLANVRNVNKEHLYNCWITFGHPMYADHVGVINDGVRYGAGAVFYTLAAEACIPKIDYLGYEFAAPRKIGMVALDMGCMEEFGGWFSSIAVQYRDGQGHWHEVSGCSVSPGLPASDEVFIQPHFVEYLFEFEPVETTAVRIIADTKVQPHWNKATKNTSAFLSVTELSVYEAE